MCHPSNNRQKVLDEALVWAAKSNWIEIFPLLVEHGANVSADPYRGTPLFWATNNGRVEAALWLIDHGVDVNQRATFGGPGHGQGVTALHLAAQTNNLPLVKLLIARGANPAIKDENYESPPSGWAAHCGAREVEKYLSGAIGLAG